MIFRSAILVLCLFCSHFVSAQGDPHFIEIANGLSQPVAVRNADDGSNRLFIVERAGRIMIYDIATKQLLPNPFLDITARVESLSGEEGLLGLAFDPDYALNGYFYVNYISPKGGGGTAIDSTQISRFQVSNGNPNSANANSEYRILSFEQPYGNHNGGDIHFGPDQLLYISTGDGGDANDPGNRAQNLNSYHGKILRVEIGPDDYPTDPKRNYGIPAGNPFIGNASALDEILHYGLRNPWRFSFDRATGEMYIGDVGQNAWEEVSYAPTGSTGLNFGWKCREGTSTFSNSTACNNAATANTLTDPIFEYSHGIGRSITGGFVYRGTTFPNFVGWYFCIDYATNRLYNGINGFAGWSFTDQFANNNISGTSSFGESESGELYAVSVTGGQLLRLIDRTVCPNSLVITTSSQSVSGAVVDISSTAVVPGNSTVDYFAGDCIALMPGFSTPASTVFSAILEICGYP